MHLKPRKRTPSCTCWPISLLDPLLLLMFILVLIEHFTTIAGSGANGAIIHYKPEPGTCSVVHADKLFLLDSGAQYHDGTTDVTRTVHFGEPSSRQRECFTRVLQVFILFLPFFNPVHDYSHFSLS